MYKRQEVNFIVTLFLTDSAIIYYVRLEVDYMSSLNRQSLGEEIANAVSHGQITCSSLSKRHLFSQLHLPPDQLRFLLALPC